MKKREKKEKKENPIYTMVLFMFFVAAILFFIIKVITGIFDKEVKYDISNIEQYIQNEEDNTINESKIIKNYAQFHLVQEVLEQFTDALINGNYSETYKVLDSEMVNKYKNKNDYVNTVREFTNNNFVIKDPDNLFVNKNKLKKVYGLSTNEYLAEYQVVDGSTKKIGIRLETKQKEYTVFYIEM